MMKKKCPNAYTSPRGPAGHLAAGNYGFSQHESLAGRRNDSSAEPEGVDPKPGTVLSPTVTSGNTTTKLPPRL